jgi:hypothetical protein
VSAAQRRRSDVRKRFEWWDDQPTLHLMVYPCREGMKLSLTYRHRPTGLRVEYEVLLEAVWSPREVTQEKIVSWAQRGLEAYLAQGLTDET